MLRASITVPLLQIHMLPLQNRAIQARRMVPVNLHTTLLLPRLHMVHMPTRLRRTQRIPRSPGRILLTMASMPPTDQPLHRSPTHTPSLLSRTLTDAHRHNNTRTLLQVSLPRQVTTLHPTAVNTRYLNSLSNRSHHRLGAGEVSKSWTAPSSAVCHFIPFCRR